MHDIPLLSAFPLGKPDELGLTVSWRGGAAQGHVDKHPGIPGRAARAAVPRLPPRGEEVSPAFCLLPRPRWAKEPRGACCWMACRCWQGKADCLGLAPAAGRSATWQKVVVSLLFLPIPSPGGFLFTRHGSLEIARLSHVALKKIHIKYDLAILMQ